MALRLARFVHNGTPFVFVAIGASPSAGLFHERQSSAPRLPNGSVVCVVIDHSVRHGASSGYGGSAIGRCQSLIPAFETARGDAWAMPTIPRTGVLVRCPVEFWSTVPKPHTYRFSATGRLGIQAVGTGSTAHWPLACSTKTEASRSRMLAFDCWGGFRRRPGLRNHGGGAGAGTVVRGCVCSPGRPPMCTTGGRACAGIATRCLRCGGADLRACDEARIRALGVPDMVVYDVKSAWPRQVVDDRL